MKRILLFLFLLNTFFCTAQNYQCLQSGVKHYFTNGNHYLRGIRLDSVAIAGDTTLYYPYKTLRSYPVYDTAGSWLGGKVLQLTDGTFLFDDIWGDKVTIKTQAELGDVWLFFSDTTLSTYMATLTAIDTMTILGLVDSIKTITVNSYHSGILNTADPINNFRIILSKNEGFIETFDLYTFPYTIPIGFFSLMQVDFYLNNLCTSGYVDSFNSEFMITSYHDPTKMEVYNFNVGDVFVGNTQNSNLGYQYYWDCHSDSVISKTYIDSDHVQYILAYGIASGSYIYDCDFMTLEYSNVSSYNCCSHDTLNADRSLIFRLQKMPEELGTDSLYYYNPFDDTLCFLSASYTAEFMPYGGTFEACPLITVIKDGFLPLYNLNCNCYGCSTGFPISCTSTTNMTYASKGNVPCGIDPILLLSVKNVPAKNVVELFPNPATTELTISFSDMITSMTINNLLGQIIYSRQCNSTQVQVDISTLPSGLYFVKVNGTEVRKFVKE